VADVTEHKRIREALQESDDRQERTMDREDRAPWIMDAEGNSLHISSRWVQTAELSRKQMRNLGWLEALHPDDLEATMKTMKNALRTGKSIDIQYRVMGFDGGWRWMRYRGLPRFSPSGEILRWYGSVEDINHTQAALHLN
jgi:PAS domain S-box-containing protein